MISPSHSTGSRWNIDNPRPTVAIAARTPERLGPDREFPDLTATELWKLLKFGDGLFRKFARMEDIGMPWNVHGVLFHVVRNARKDVTATVIASPNKWNIVWLCLFRGRNFFRGLALPSVILPMGRRNRPKQGDPEPLFEGQSSSSKASKRKADDEGKPYAKKVKPGNSKGKGKQVLAPNGAKAKKRGKIGASASVNYEDDSRFSVADEEGQENLEAHKKYDYHCASDNTTERFLDSSSREVTRVSLLGRHLLLVNTMTWSEY